MQETESASKGRFELAIALAMPDHVHLLLCPLELTEGIYHSLSSILKLIKGRSANRINALLGRKGSFWQKESFDRIVRDQHEWQEKYQYILNNPVKAGLALRPTEYSWVVLGDKYK
ncbi:MAG: transposase [Nitrospinae bacterium]|nr:transposase [Nitrospinota bacterium]